MVTPRSLQSGNRDAAADVVLSSTVLSDFFCTPPDDPQRLILRTIEATTGRRFILRVYDDLRRNPSTGESFWSGLVRRLDLRLDYNEDGLARLPRSGPLVIVANHPFGVLDGVIIADLMSRARHDFVLLTSNSVFNHAGAVRSQLLPIDTPETRQALEPNRMARAAAVRHLLRGGVLVMFPAGRISTSSTMWSKRAVDAQWKNFAARLIVSAKAPVLPIYIAGQNSRVFQVASHISNRLRRSLFFKEIYDKVGTVLRVEIGELIPHSELETLDRPKLMQHLRRKTYELDAACAGRHRGKPR